ncbi:hypothetical protein D3C80_393480 [compost metagenome]
MVATVEDRIIAVVGFLHEMVSYQFTHYALGLVILIIGGHHLQLFAVTQFGKQPFFKYVRVIGDQNVRRLQNTLARTVVLLQLDHLQRREVFLQQHQVLRARTAPGVD